MKAKRQGAYIAALLIFFFSVFPAKNSDAFGFFLIPLVMGVTIATAMGASAFCEIDSCFTPSIAANSQVLSVEIRPTDGKPNIRVPTTSDPSKTEMVMPSPSAPATATGTQVGGVPANADTVQAARCDSGPGGGCGAVDSLTRCLADYQAGLPGRYCQVVTPGDANYLKKYGSGGCEGCESSTPATSCPTGYTVSGAGCALSNARAATPDSKADYKRTSSGYTTAGDADEASVSDVAKMPPGTGQIVVNGADAKGNPRVITVGVDGAGHTMIRTQTQVASPGGQSVIKTSSYTVEGGTGQVVSQSSSSAAGSIDNSTGSPVVNTGAGVTPGDGQGFPSDYARAGEAAQAANTIKTSVDQLKDRLTDSATLADPEAPQYTSHWGDTFTGLFSWSLPAHTSTCPVATFDAFERTFRMDSHCQLAADYWETLRVAMVVVWVILALFILLRA